MPRPLREAVRWLIQPEAERSLRMLRELREEPEGFRELTSKLKIGHPPQFYRSVGYLEDLGLVERLHDFSRERRGEIFRITPLGKRACTLVDRVERVLASGPDDDERKPSVETGAKVISSAR